MKITPAARKEVWCDWEGKPTSLAGPLPSIDMVSSGKVYASPQMLRFRDPEKFVAGNISNYSTRWSEIVQNYPKVEDILRYVSEGIRVDEFFVPFRGKFQGHHYNSATPPKKHFRNASSCSAFKEFIHHTILERVANGSLQVWGQMGMVDPPHLVMPITVEPGKPSMCHDERFLNCWIKDLPFTLDYLTDLPRNVSPGHYQTTFDDKSGYDHIRLHPSSYQFFGLAWEGWYFTYVTLPFGWKASAYLYNSIGMAATHFIRSKGVPCSQYIDDRHVGQLRLSGAQASSGVFSGAQLAEMAAFIACSVLISLGYVIGLKKSVLVPSTTVKFLGYICDSERQAFILPQDKREKFATLREAYCFTRASR